MIYHVLTGSDWKTALLQGYYAPASLALEGFIHTSKQTQVKGVLERYYQHQPDLLLLHINEGKLTAELKYEVVNPDQETFPHIYGQLNLDAIIKVAVIDDNF